jgi:hypothetical protein
MNTQPHNLEARKERLVAEIHQAFATTKLGSGLSWSQTVQLDDYEPEEIVRAGRHVEPPHWLELVDDAEWHPFPGIGGYSFIDADGFRFYLPPTMIRIVREPCEWYPGHLVGIINRFAGWEPESIFSETQCRCVAKFLEFMSDLEAEQLRDWAVENPWGGIPPDHESDHWRMALNSFWNRYLSP